MVPDIPDFAGRERLSPRELQVVSLLVHGLTNKETARELGIAPKTVHTYLWTTHLKLGVSRAVHLSLLVYGGLGAVARAIVADEATLPST